MKPPGYPGSRFPLGPARWYSLIRTSPPAPTEGYAVVPVILLAVLEDPEEARYLAAIAKPWGEGGIEMSFEAKEFLYLAELTYRPGEVRMLPFAEVEPIPKKR